MKPYERGGRWYVLAEVDPRTKIERPARPEEIQAQARPEAAQPPAPPTPTPRPNPPPASAPRRRGRPPKHRKE